MEVGVWAIAYGGLAPAPPPLIPPHKGEGNGTLFCTRSLIGFAVRDNEWD